MMPSPRLLFIFVSAVFLAAASPVQALTEPEATAGRTLVKRYADAVVGVEMVVTIRVSMGGSANPPRERKIDVNGTVLAANGLTVTSLAAIDPKAEFEAQRASMPGGSRIEIADTDYKEVKLRLADGFEIPAKVVLKDADLDLAFIVPDPEASAPRTFTAVNLDEGVEASILDSYFSVARAPKSLQRVPMVRPILISGVVERPRRLLLASDLLMGCPVVDAKGRVVGITVQYVTANRALVILPAADVSEVAKQAAAVNPATVPSSTTSDAPSEKAPPPAPAEAEKK